METLKQLFHKYLGWPYLLTGRAIGGDSFQPIYDCRYCSHPVAKDSQGNYFHLA